MQISELLCRAEYIMRATRALRVASFQALSFRSRAALGETLQLSHRPPILANCTLQLISDTARTPE